MTGRRAALASIAVAAVCLSALAGIAAAGEVSGYFTLGNARFELGAKYRPDRAPADRYVPIRLKAWMDITTDDGSVPPRMDEVVIDLEKYVRFARRGLGVCEPAEIEFASTKGARKRCHSALVGGGRVSAIVKLEDQRKFTAKGRLSIFNGVDADGDPAVLVHTLASVPLPTTFLIVGELGRSPLAGYRQRITAQIPVVAQGQGSMSSFRIRLKKRPRGKRFFIGRCPKGRVKVQAAFDMHPEPPTYPEGRDFQVNMVGSCLTTERHSGRRSQRRSQRRSGLR